MAFEVVQKNFNMLSINSKQAKKSNPINKRIFAGLILLFFNALFQYLYLFCDAHGFQEYIESIYMASIGTVSFVILTNTVLKMDMLFSLIDWVDEITTELENDTGKSQRFGHKKQQSLYSHCPFLLPSWKLCP